MKERITVKLAHYVIKDFYRAVEQTKRTKTSIVNEALAASLPRLLQSNRRQSK